MTVPLAPSVLSCLLPPVSRGPFPARPAPPGLPQGVPQAGRASLEGELKLSVTRDKDPLDIPAYPMIPLSSHGAGRDEGGCQVYMHRRCYFRFIAVFGASASACLCLHTLLQPAVDVAHFLACVSALVYPRRCWLFPQ